MPVKSASHHHTCRQSTDHHCSGCCSCECCGGSRKYHRHYRTHRRRYSMNEEEKKDHENKPIFTEEFHQMMFPEEPSEEEKVFSDQLSNISARRAVLASFGDHYPIAEITVTGQKQNMANVQLIPIRNILYDQGMINKIKTADGRICKPRIRGNAQQATLKILKGWTGPLGKWGPKKMWDNTVIPGVWADIQNKVPLDPIVVKRRDDVYYEVMDGRHRATASLCAGYDFVPAFVQN